MSLQKYFSIYATLAPPLLRDRFCYVKVETTARRNHPR